MKEIIGRIKTAIEFLRDGLPFKVGELYMGIDDKGILNITGTSQAIALKNITKKRALEELKEIKSIFREMLSISTELTEYISNKQIKYNLDFDYGMGDIRICSEINEDVRFEIELK